MSGKTGSTLRDKVAPLDLSPPAALVAYALATLIPLDERESVAVSNETLMKWTNYSKNTVRKGLKELTLKSVITSRPGKIWTDSAGKIRSEPTLYIWGAITSDHWQSADLNKAAVAAVVIDEKTQNISPHRGSQFDLLKESESKPIENESSKEWLILATLVEAALESNPTPTVITLAKAMTEDREHVAERLESIAAKSQWNRGSYIATIWKKTPELFLPRVELRKSPYVGGLREWVLDHHNIGEHFECRPGEFGHPEAEPIQLDLMPDSSPWAAMPWVGKG